MYMRYLSTLYMVEAEITFDWHFALYETTITRFRTHKVEVSSLHHFNKFLNFQKIEPINRLDNPHHQKHSKRLSRVDSKYPRPPMWRSVKFFPIFKKGEHVCDISLPSTHQHINTSTHQRSSSRRWKLLMIVLICWCGYADVIYVLMYVLMIVLMRWCVDVWWLSCVDVLMCWCDDVLMCWCVDVLMFWCVVLMCWSVDVLDVLVC